MRSEYVLRSRLTSRHIAITSVLKYEITVAEHVG